MDNVQGFTGVLQNSFGRFPKVVNDYNFPVDAWHEGNALFTPVWQELQEINSIGIEKYVDKFFYTKNKKNLTLKSKSNNPQRAEGLEYLCENYLLKQNYTTILEVGCGQGQAMLWFASQKKKYIGIDIAFVNIGFCISLQAILWKVGNPETYLYRMSAENLMFKDKSFDVVFSCHTLEHVYNLDKALREQFRVGKNVCGVVPIPRDLEDGAHLQKVSVECLDKYFRELSSEYIIEQYSKEIIFYGRSK